MTATRSDPAPVVSAERDGAPPGPMGGWPWAASAAALTGVLSVCYAIAYLVIAPSAQRDSDAGALLRSVVDDPWGMRIAGLCLVGAGVASGFALVALRARLRRPWDTTLQWATVAGVAGGLATAAHGLGEMVSLDRLAHRYVDGDAATKAAAVVSQALPSQVDPIGLATFGLAGVVALVVGARVLDVSRRLGWLGVVYGITLLALFASSAAGLGGAVLVTGGLASLVVGPVWWFGVARLVLRRPATPAAGGIGG